MPTPHRHQATSTPRASIPTSIALTRPSTAAWRCLLRACRSVAQALDHEGKGDATGTQVIGHPQERAMPKPHRRQAAWTPRVSAPPSVALASHGSNRACVEMPLEGVAQCFSGARARRECRSVAHSLAAHAPNIALSLNTRATGPLPLKVMRTLAPWPRSGGVANLLVLSLEREGGRGELRWPVSSKYAHTRSGVTVRPRVRRGGWGALP